MIVGIGLDVVPISRIAALLERHGRRAERRLFSDGERSDYDCRAEPAQHYAARFAANEALLKALSAPPGSEGSEIEIRTADTGRPVLLPSGAAAAAAAHRGVTGQHVSLTHPGGIAAAGVVLEAGP